MKTYNAKKEEISKKWHLIDLNGKVLGRAATQIADILRGKNKPTYTPNADAGDFVVVINASKVKLTGNKAEQKNYYWYTCYPGGLKSVQAKDWLVKKPEAIVLAAVKGMLPKNILSKSLITKLKVYAGETHPHISQNPVS